MWITNNRKASLHVFLYLCGEIIYGMQKFLFSSCFIKKFFSSGKNKKPFLDMSSKQLH